MKLDREMIAYISRLCRIQCGEEALEQMLVDLGKIFSYVEQLNEVDTEGVPPCNHVLDMTNVMREDRIGESLTREEFLANVPVHTGGYVKVPPVIKKGG